MYRTFANFLSVGDCKRLREIAAAGEFTTGDRTVKGDLRSVKQNQELASNNREVDDILHKAIAGCSEMRDFIIPRTMKPPILSRYVDGMNYGRHLDTPLLFAGQTIRSDMSMTVFLNPADTYDGGELVMETDYGEHQVKLPAGHAVVYDTQQYHWVAPVTRGERLALVTWFQSLVAEPSNRAILFELRLAFKEIAPRDPDAESTRRLQKVLNNLTRRWVQP
jgi:PKHD-type hydroxylase